ncbi:hypothetical protein GGR50DRAFT_160545 [Xylaria sp. CBS 124048]|nr:hypothetical protein GGR50DRAFT_160545 [Xylaria sp. CBS 124048]
MMAGTQSVTGLLSSQLFALGTLLGAPEAFEAREAPGDLLAAYSEGGPWRQIGMIAGNGVIGANEGTVVDLSVDADPLRNATRKTQSLFYCHPSQGTPYLVTAQSL